MVAEPPAKAVIFPFWSTDATFSLLELHTIVLLVASSGEIVAPRVFESPFSILKEVSDSVMLATLTLTVTLQEAENCPSVDVTVIVAEPAPTAVTTPEVLTVAIEGSEVFHVTVVSVAF